MALTPIPRTCKRPPRWRWKRAQRMRSRRSTFDYSRRLSPQRLRRRAAMGTLASDCHGESSSSPDQRQPDGGDQRADEHSHLECDQCHLVHGIGRLGRQQGAVRLADRGAAFHVDRLHAELHGRRGFRGLDGARDRARGRLPACADRLTLGESDERRLQRQYGAQLVLEQRDELHGVGVLERHESTHRQPDDCRHHQQPHVHAAM